MKVTTPCFIKKNTPELRQKLERLRIISHAFNEDSHNGIHSTGGRFMTFCDSDFPHLGAIDCGTNEALFLALAALREDSDYMQWFVSKEFNYDRHEKTYNKITHEYARHMNVGDFYLHTARGKFNSKRFGYCQWRKATPAELIEHFKTKN